MRRLAIVLLFAGSVLAACSTGSSDDGGFPEGAFAVTASSDVAVGSNRLLVGVSLPDGTRLGSPDDPVEFEVSPRDDPAAAARYPAHFVWIVEGAVGIYRAQVETGAAGIWNVSVIPADGDAIGPAAFEVRSESLTPAVGSPAIVAPSPTLDDLPIDRLTTDPEPDPSFYDTSLDEAIGAGRPAVVVFATPAFCQTASCGPMLESAKQIAADHPDVDFVHVEVYEGIGETGFAPDADHLAPAVVAWGLPSEPWVFVVDSAGIVAAKYEGVLDPAELDDALDGL